MTTIKVDGEDIDVTGCAIAKCGAAPRPPRRPMGMFGGNLREKREYDAAMATYRPLMSKRSACVMENCHPDNAVVNTHSSPVSTLPNVGKDIVSLPNNLENRGGGTVKSPEADLPQLEESWAKKNSGILYIGGAVAVLGITGLIIYLVKR